ncbi:MAG: hypothetical protein FWD16_05605, partial [Clostridia bacterium]|nr:hypothetical protein [Clostridia bacterium]
MKNRRTAAWIIAALLTLSLLPFGLRAATFSGEGKGTEAEPYIIKTPVQLSEIRLAPNAFYELGNNIDLPVYLTQDEGWEPIQKFCGSLKGRGFSVIGLRINRPDEDYVGLFGELTEGAYIQGVVLEGAKIAGRDMVGGVAGGTDFHGAEASLFDCKVSGEIKGREFVGGIIGNAASGVYIEGCKNYAAVIGTGLGAGGIAGMCGGLAFDTPSIYKCANYGDITGRSSVGGIVGRNGSGSTPMIMYSLSRAKITASSNAGGIAGALYGTVIECAFAGTITSNSVAGGLVGSSGSGLAVIENSYAYGDFRSPATAGQASFGSLVGVGGVVLNNCWASFSTQTPDAMAGIIHNINLFSTITNCYFDKERLGYDKTYNTVNFGAEENVVVENNYGLTSADLMDKTKMPTLDWTGIWDITEGTFPCLRSLAAIGSLEFPANTGWAAEYWGETKELESPEFTFSGIPDTVTAIA